MYSNNQYKDDVDDDLNGTCWSEIKSDDCCLGGKKDVKFKYYSETYSKDSFDESPRIIHNASSC